jgi:hypothetical protein
MLIQPTVGRKVWYWPHPVNNADMNTELPEQPLDATILFVHAARQVNLLVVDHMGHPHFISKAYLKQPDAEPPADEGYAEWMPFQVGQATTTPPKD